VASSVWKQVRLGFPSLASRLVEARLRVVHMASSRRSCRVEEAEDEWVDAMGCVGPFYLNIVVFIVFGLKGILVFHCIVVCVFGCHKSVAPTLDNLQDLLEEDFE
jgi:hypothetical protein